MGALRLDDRVLALVSEGLRDSHVDQAKEHQAAVARLQAEYDRIQGRLHAMYVDKLDGKVDGGLFDKLSADWRKEQDRCLWEISRLQEADQSYLEEGITLLEMARDSQELFDVEQPAEKRRLLNFVCSNSVWKNGELRATYREPFNLIAEMSAVASVEAAAQGPISTSCRGWLGD